MPMTRFSQSIWIALVSLCLLAAAVAQTETATVVGQVTDSSGAIVNAADVVLRSVERGTVATVTTNDSGLYVFASVAPGQYQVTVTKAGFRQIDFLGLNVNVQDHIEQNFRLQVGSVSESITVQGNTSLINTQDAAVSTVVDRNFADNLPLNGRSFQTLIQLSPGVVTAPSSLSDGGQFNVNGQRAAANYWMVDGVGANIGIASYSVTGNGLSGGLGSFSALGGTNGLVSADAMQEFRIQTSTYAPEFGRTPGGQVSIVTRSGGNQFHGTAFDYLRNDAMNANDWFANNAGLPKPQERQNDFGGTFSGPVFKDKTFFFFSYEGLRLRLPQAQLTTVPDIASRQTAIPAMQPYLNAFPLPNGTDDPSSGIAAFNIGYADPASLNAYSLRLDHKLKGNITLFGRYNYSPSSIIQRGSAFEPLSNLFASRNTTQTATAGGTWLFSPRVTADVRLNYSTTDAANAYSLDNFGGAVPLTSLQFPAPYNASNALLFFTIDSLSNASFGDGPTSHNKQRQWNLVDDISIQKGAHSIKFGSDYRRLSPIFAPFLYNQSVFFSTVSSAEAGLVDNGGSVQTNAGSIFLFRNFGAFVQDTWLVRPRLTITYGLRWDVDFTPSTLAGPNVPAATGFNLNDLSHLALAPSGTPPFRTTYGNLAPRFGFAYQVSENSRTQSVLRAGVGLFYDLADSETGNIVGNGSYPFGATTFFSTASFPLDPTTAAAPPIVPSSIATGTLSAFDPNLKLPYSLEWNVAFEQALGAQQALTAAYIGSQGHRLLQTSYIIAPTPDIGSGYLVANSADSDYNALQMRYQRRFASSVQALASYTWAHSIDSASAGSAFGGEQSSTAIAGLPGSNRGPSDFDIRHTFSLATTYDIPSLHGGNLSRRLSEGWALDNVVQANSAPPVNVFERSFYSRYNFTAVVRPDLVAGQPLYLHGDQCPQYAGSVCPGGFKFNPAAFTAPPADPITGRALRQGDLGRNALRGFGLTSWDVAMHRTFPIRESVRLQFRAELFNILNHPNFGPPRGGHGRSSFGAATQTIGQYRGQNVGSGGFSPLYQSGGPRSIQVALKLIF
jgi:hypothetical protein